MHTLTVLSFSTPEGTRNAHESVRNAKPGTNYRN